MPYLFAAFCATWLVVFLYMLSISRRQRALAQEIETLRKMMAVDERREAGGGKT